MMILDKDDQIILNAAEIVGLSASDAALSEARAELRRVETTRARVYAAVGLDPAKRYNVNRETGEVREEKTSAGIEADA